MMSDTTSTVEHSTSSTATDSASTLELEPSGEKSNVWRAGTLTYHRAGLVRLFVLLFLGFFTVALEQGALPMMLPLLLRGKGFNAGQIGTLLALFPIASLVLGPIIGVMTDRTRSRWGRRRPFLLLFTPFWALGLILLPHVHAFWLVAGVLLLTGIAATASGVLQAFYNDVIPPVLMGRFIAGISLVYSLASIVFQAGIMRYFDTHPATIFVGLAILGAGGQMLMALGVREGQYPPPPPRKSITDETVSFLREGFANRYVILLWLTMGMTALGGPAIGNYFALFYTDAKTGMHMTSAELGTLYAIGSAIGMVLLIPAGWIVDQFGPKRIWAISGLAVGIIQVGMFFAAGPRTVFWLYLAFACANTVLSSSLSPLTFAYIPQANYGQLTAASGLVSRGLNILGLQACGWLIAVVQDDYRYAFLVGGLCYVLVPVFMFFLAREPYPYVGMPTTMHPDGKRGRRDASHTGLEGMQDDIADRPVAVLEN